jgi:hypothetical protein
MLPTTIEDTLEKLPSRSHWTRYGGRFLDPLMMMCCIPKSPPVPLVQLQLQQVAVV